MEPAMEPAPAGGGGYTLAVTMLATSTAGMMTMRMEYTLGADQDNAYVLAGLAGQPLTMPPAFQLATPFGADIGGANPAFFAIMADAEFDSWITVGMTDGSSPGAIAASPGFGIDTWTNTVGFSQEDGAIFWMTPSDGPVGPVVTLMQVTVPTGSTGTATGVIQGQCLGNAGTGPMAGTSAMCDSGTYQDHVMWAY